MKGGGADNNYIAEEFDRHYLSQVIQISISTEKSRWENTS